MEYGLSRLCAVGAQGKGFSGLCGWVNNFSCLVVTLLLVGCGTNTDDISLVKHDVDNPIRDGAAWNWHELSDAEENDILKLAFEDEPFVDRNSEVTKRVEFWIGKFDSKLRELFPNELRNVPVPKALVIDSEEPNAFAVALPKCYDVPVLLDSDADRNIEVNAKAALINIVKSKIVTPPSNDPAATIAQIFGGYADVEPLCLESSNKVDEETIRLIVEGFNNNTTRCMLTLERDSSGGLVVVVGKMCQSAFPENIKKAKRLVVPVSINRITVTTGMFDTLSSEQMFVAVIAHELAHYYKSHMTLALDTYAYNFFYKLDAERNPMMRPTADPESRVLGEEVKAASVPFTKYARITDQKFRSEFFLPILSMLGNIERNHLEVIAKQNEEIKKEADTISSNCTNDASKCSYSELFNIVNSEIDVDVVEEGIFGLMKFRKKGIKNRKIFQKIRTALREKNRRKDDNHKQVQSNEDVTVESLPVEKQDEEVLSTACQRTFDWLNNESNLRHLVGFPVRMFKDKKSGIEKYLEVEELFEGCLKDIVVDDSESKQAKGLKSEIVKAAFGADSDISKSFANLKIEGNLLDILKEAEKALLAYYTEIREPFDKAARHRLGYYTYEQEADDLSVELMSKIGLDPENAVMAYMTLATIKGHLLELLGKEEVPHSMGFKTCTELHSNGWKDSNGNPVFVSVADYRDPHHNECYRAYNLSREIKVHNYNASGVAKFTDYPIDNSWSDIVSKAIGSGELVVSDLLND